MSAYHYEFSISGYHKVSAQAVGEMIEELSSKGVEVTPEVLLDASRDENSLTHCEFEWDDTVAAEKYRLTQSYDLIRHIRIVREEKKPEEYQERGFVPIPGGRNVFVPLDKALGKEEYRDFLIKQARNDMQIFLGKYRRIEELASVTEPMKKYLNVG